MVARHDWHRPLYQPPALNGRNVTRSCYRTSNAMCHLSDKTPMKSKNQRNDAGFGRMITVRRYYLLSKKRTAVPAGQEGKNDSGKTRLKGGRREQSRIIAQFPVEFRFKADGGNFQIVQGITNNLNYCLDRFLRLSFRVNRS
jgi:hypothetical protein